VKVMRSARTERGWWLVGKGGCDALEHRWSRSIQPLASCLHGWAGGGHGVRPTGGLTKGMRYGGARSKGCSAVISHREGVARNTYVRCEREFNVHKRTRAARGRSGWAGDSAARSASIGSEKAARPPTCASPRKMNKVPLFRHSISSAVQVELWNPLSREHATPRQLAPDPSAIAWLCGCGVWP